jgi:hypothetical protein
MYLETVFRIFVLMQYRYRVLWSFQEQYDMAQDCTFIKDIYRYKMFAYFTNLCREMQMYRARVSSQCFIYIVK